MTEFTNGKPRIDLVLVVAGGASGMKCLLVFSNIAAISITATLMLNQL